jgi:hypothetical protein
MRYLLTEAALHKGQSQQLMWRTGSLRPADATMADYDVLLSGP